MESLLASLVSFPENRPIVQDSGLWEMWSDNMEEILLVQGVDESLSEFVNRCAEYEKNKADYSKFTRK